MLTIDSYRFTTKVTLAISDFLIDFSLFGYSFIGFYVGNLYDNSIN